MQQPRLVEPFIARLEKLGLPYMITGSMAGILYGEPRLTHDIDIVVAMGVGDIPAFVDAFPIEEFYCPPADVLAIEIRRGQRGHCNLIHHESGFKADIYLAYDELHRWALQQRRVLDLGGLRVAVAPPEYVIVRKLEYYREGKSDKHLRDIRGILDVTEIDRAVVEQWAERLHLEREWSTVASS